MNVARKKATATAAAEAVGIQIVQETGRTSLIEAKANFVAAAMGRGAKESAEIYEQALDEFFETCKKVYTDELDHPDVVAFHANMRKKKRSDRTIFNRHVNLRAFFLFPGVNGPALKTLAGKKPRYDKTLPDIYEPSELTISFKKTVHTDYDKLFFDLLLETGLREREAMHLEWTDIKWERQALKVQSKPAWSHKIKDAEEREVPLSNALIKKLKAYRAEHSDDRLIFCRNGGKNDQTPDGHLLRRLKTMVRNAGLNCGQCEGCTRDPERSVTKKVRGVLIVKAPPECENWYLHKFRANYITTLLRNKMDLRTVMTLSGHSDLASVERYIRPADREDIQASINSIKFR